MKILIGFQNFLNFINNHWTTIIVIIGSIIAVAKKIKDYVSKTDEEKIEIAKKQIKEVILNLITDAELDYQEWNKAGSIKRSQVIERIFTMYPILSKALNQEDLIAWIDTVIDEALTVMRSVFEQNAESLKN